METIIKIMVIIVVKLFYFGLAFNPLEMLGGADLLKQHLVSDLGMKHEPNVKKANLSISEYLQMIAIYEDTIRQAEEIKKLREQFQNIHHSVAAKQVIKYSQMRYKIGELPLLQPQAILQFSTSQVRPQFGLTLVTSAILTINIKRSSSFSTITRKAGVTQLLNEEEGVTIDTVNVEDEDQATLEFDVTDAVQAWIENPQTNKGLMVTADGCQIDTEEGKEAKLTIETKFALIRHKRSFFLEYSNEKEVEGKTDCFKKNNKCCRDDMKVNLRELEGFAFILEPKEFNAYQCHGKCPPRYRPLNDHSLLQSLMHIKHQKNAVESHESAKVKKPCCVPSKLSSLPILHLDENNPTKLKVTTWKSIVVTECACG